MTKEQLKHLEEELLAGGVAHEEHECLMPPGPRDRAPYEYALSICPRHAGQYSLDLRVWSGYYGYPATRTQPAEQGWADYEDIRVTSPFLTDCLTELENRGIDLPTPCMVMPIEEVRA